MQCLFAVGFNPRAVRNTTMLNLQESWKRLEKYSADYIKTSGWGLSPSLTSGVTSVIKQLFA